MSNPKMQVEVGADISGVKKGMSDVKKELASTAIQAQKLDSSVGKLNTGISDTGKLSNITSSALSGLGSTLLSGGIALGVAAATTALFALAKTLLDVSAEQKRFNEVLEGAKSAYVKAVLEVDKMRDAFEKAKAGIITKEDALKLYNSTIGKTIGKTNDLDIAERNFIANAENYIKYTLYKAAAQTALSKAAEAAFEAESAALKDKQSRGFLEAYVSQEELKRRRVAEALKKQSEFQAIYNSLIAKANAFGFTAVEQLDKQIVKTEKLTKVKKEAAKLLIPELEFKVQNPEQEIPLSDTFLTPRVLVKPKIKFIDQSANQQAVFDGVAEMLDVPRIEKELEQISQIIKDSTVNALSGVGESIGEALISGEKPLPKLFDGLKADLGAQLKELGKFLISTGLQMQAAKKAFENLLKNPVAQVIAGIALVALGSALQASVRKKNKGFATGVRNFQPEGDFVTVGERGPENIFLPRGSTVQPNNEVNAYGRGGITLMPSLHYEGTGFRIMLNRVDAQLGRNN